MESSPDMCKETTQELEDLLQCDSEPTINTSSQYIAHEKSIKSAPDCKKCEFLVLYITYAEQAMGQLQDEIYRLKNEKENNQALSKTPMNENHREDKPHLNKSIDVINSVLSRQRSGITFVNPNNGHNVDILKRDRLHMNAKGCKMMAQNIVNAIVEVFTMVI